jgi:hypothetical protein
MATRIDVSWVPDPVHFGGGVTIIATLTPTPPPGAHIWIFVDGVSSGQLDADNNGQASISLSALSVGAHTVEAAFATADSVDSDSTPPSVLEVLAAVVADPSSDAIQGTAPSLNQSQNDNQMPSDVGFRMQAGSGAFYSVSNIDPFTGEPAADPFTGEPLSARDASINDRIRAVFSQPDAISESTRNAILDFYAKPGIDLTGVPQSFQSSILDIYSRAEAPLPGIGLDELFGFTLSSIANDLSRGIRLTVNQTTFLAELPYYAGEMVLEASVRPALGFVGLIGGAAEMVAGAVSAFGSAGLAAVPGAVMAAHGLDTSIAGFRTMLGADASTLTHYAFEQVVGPKYAGMAEVLSTVALGSLGGLVGEVGGFGSRFATAEAAAAARIELEATVLRELPVETATMRAVLSEPAVLRGSVAEAAAIRTWSEPSVLREVLMETASIRSELSEATVLRYSVAEAAASRTWSESAVLRDVLTETEARQLPEVLRGVLAQTEAMRAELSEVSSLSDVKSMTAVPTGPSFEGLINIEEFENSPAIIDRLTRAREFDIGGYYSMTGRGEFGRPFDGLDADEVLQNAYLRERLGVQRLSAVTRDNPAIALSPDLHRQIDNLRTIQMQGLTPEQVLQYHLEQMDFVPDYIQRTLELEALQYIGRTFP